MLLSVQLLNIFVLNGIPTLSPPLIIRPRCYASP